jgi:putative CocE/NonD family hydrolase
MSGVPNAWAAAAEFASVAFHRNVMLPFYDHYLKGLETSWTSRPPVEYAVRGSNHVRTAQQWPPENVRYEKFYLDPARSGAVHSLNDGALSTTPPDSGSTSYAYPNPGWVAGVVGFGPKGPPGGFDPARRVLTFTGPVLQSDLEIAGPLKVTLYASSSATDTDFFVKVSDQFPQAAAEFEQGLNPGFEAVTRGWLRASHRAIDEAESTEMTPVHPHDREEPLTPGEITEFEISIEPQAYLFKAGHRVRLEIVNGDSPMTEALWPHYYRPDKVGTDTIYHGPDHPSVLILPVADPASA